MDENGYKKIISELIEMIPEGVYIVDENGVGMFYNSAMEATEKILKSDVIDKEFHHAFPGVELSQSTMYQALRKGVSTKNKRQTYTNLYGKEVMTINSTAPVTLDGKTIAAIEVARDITDIQSMSDTILKLQEDQHPQQKETRTPRIRHYSFEDLSGNSQVFNDVMIRARRAAGNNASVFIYGETGTGKELFAQSIHYASARQRQPFLAQNCAALPESLLEGILFGTVRGGFTGAVDRAGLFEQASGGTLLLDEISAMPYDLQSKLLRVLQESYIRRVGGSKDIPIDVRIIATVNEPPEKLIEEGKLRADLYYRLNVVSLSIPPLRERKEDIPELVEALLAKHDQEYQKQLWMVSDAAMKRLMDYDYPGNVRELENIIIQAVAMAENEHVLTNRLLQMPRQISAVGKDAQKWRRTGPLNEYIAELEKEIIRGAMISESGNVTKAAEVLQIKRQTLQHKLKKYGMIDR